MRPPTADGRWLLLVASPPHWPGLANAIGSPELLEDPRSSARSLTSGGEHDRDGQQGLRHVAHAG
jgi:crotonobetainyl-CoA:carnitine CoA-transferase CaiB-like acyl-CoA transferase